MTIVVYSKNNCVFCNKAKHLTKSLGLTYTEKKMEEFDSPQAMLEDIGKDIEFTVKLRLPESLQPNTFKLS